jgi:hypothetical protein
MAEDEFTIDYAGARGSNAGDQYHHAQSKCRFVKARPEPDFK